ncbi:MAG: hypothetical protein JWQ27_2311 [Ferruginibacter sp.]|nr:hypothetical protein [Ferruginibacter sp.]
MDTNGDERMRKDMKGYERMGLKRIKMVEPQRCLYNDFVFPGETQDQSIICVNS